MRTTKARIIVLALAVAPGLGMVFTTAKPRVRAASTITVNRRRRQRRRDAAPGRTWLRRPEKPRLDLHHPQVTSIQVGTHRSYSATGVYCDGSTRDITSSVVRSSSNTSSASIDASGLATRVGALSSTIIKATLGGVSDSACATDVIGNNGNDFLFFQGVVENLSTTLTNDYTGETIVINDTYNVNTSIYDGLGGTDTLLMTNVGDALFLVNDANCQTLFSIERIVAGDGGDIVDLASTTITLGDTFIDGGHSDDIIWANAGNDTINGATGNDRIDGGPGNDSISGGDGDDTVDGGAGNDTVHGDAGNDMLVYTPSQNTGNTDTYEGGTGVDTLVLKLTNAQANAYAADIAAARAFIAAHYDDTSSTGPGYTFSSFGLTISNIEALTL